MQIHVYLYLYLYLSLPLFATELDRQATEQSDIYSFHVFGLKLCV